MPVSIKVPQIGYNGYFVNVNWYISSKTHRPEWQYAWERDVEDFTRIQRYQHADIDGLFKALGVDAKGFWKNYEEKLEAAQEQVSATATGDFRKIIAERAYIDELTSVSEDGTVTAVGEGSAVISVVCGDYTVECNVTCAFVEESSVPDVEPEDEEATDIPEETEISDEDATEAPADADATEAPSEEVTEAPTEEATEAATEEATEAPAEEATEAVTEPVEGLELKLSKSDISFDRVGVYYTLKVTDGIDPKDVKWVSTNSRVCVVENGVITITGTGMATVKATYNGQEATCVVRVSKGK